MTLEWIRGVREQGLGYQDLKEMARNSIEFSFLPGVSLYENRNQNRLIAPFRHLREAGWKPDATIQRLLASSEKLHVQVRLERAFVEFEKRF